MKQNDELDRGISITKAKIHWPSVCQFAGSIIAIFIAWGASLAIFLVGWIERSQSYTSLIDTLSPFLLAGSLALSGLLLVPSAVFSLQRILGKDQFVASDFSFFRHSNLWILFLPILLLIGHWASQSPDYAWILLPPIHVAAVGLPVLWLARLGVNRIPLGSLQRRWGVFASGLILGPGLIVIAELAGLVLLAIGVLSWASSQPELVERLTSLIVQFSNGDISPEKAVESFSPYILNPLVIFSVLGYGSLVVPIIEEALKPIGVWLLFRRPITSAEGFAAGILSGAGYALFESMLLATGGNEWLFVVTARIGTAVIHILTTGLMGMAIVSAWRHNQFISLAVTYCVNIILHGLWNGMTLLSVFRELANQSEATTTPFWLERLAVATPSFLIFLTIGAFLLLLIGNRKLQTAYH